MTEKQPKKEKHPPYRERVDRLDRIVDVRKEAARVYREMKAERIAPEVGTKLCYVLEIIRRMIESEPPQTGELIKISFAKQLTNDEDRSDGSQGPPTEGN